MDQMTDTGNALRILGANLCMKVLKSQQKSTNSEAVVRCT